MSELLAWGWVFTLPGLALTSLGLPSEYRRAGWASIPGPVVLLAVAGFTLVSGQTADITFSGWLPFLPDGAFRARVDGLSAALLTVLGFVGSVVYVYSLGYMAGDPGKRRFFAYLDLFLAAMAILLLAGNLAVLLIGWTGVGISSFLLISFYRDREGTLRAGLQALGANALGDGALLLAAVLVPAGCGSLTELGTPRCTAGLGGPELLAALLLLAAAAKSAQGPLYFWLPSAMAGPTPISALIHAATMVAAGVYLLVRTSTLLDLAPTTALWAAALGVSTAVGASVASILQPNFKRAIAYSTVAQLGYMFAAIGVGASFAAFFHLTTHAMFKALLFLSAGVVIHATDGQEMLAGLGGLRRRLPVSYWGFLIGSLALIGVPLTSGAFSKDAIVEEALARQPIVGYVLLATVLLTGLYIGRLFFRVYHGPERAIAPAEAGQGEPSERHGETFSVHDSTRSMDLPLVALMIAALLLGFLAWPGGVLQTWLGGAAGEARALQPTSGSGLIAAALGLAGFGLGGVLASRERAAERAPVGIEVAGGGWINRIGGAGAAAGRSLAAVQSGQLARYAFGSVLAVGAILLIRLAAPL